MCQAAHRQEHEYMSAESVFILFGGLALFLYGMHMMSSNLEVIAGHRMKAILEKLTANRFLGVFVGAAITAIIQSSSATTVMVVGFVNSGLMTLKQAVWIIMGANIGTTVTGQLIALDIGMVAPLIAFIGVVPAVFIKNKKLQSLGGILAGLGILFIGMNLMSESMMPLRSSELFINMMTQFKNPVIGILTGMVFTAVIQSSSASVGILQALAVSGLIGLDGAVYVLFGQNIGTCITAVLASLGANRNAKRTTLIHLLFNIIGTVCFLLVSAFTPFTEWMKAVTDNPAAQIANVHTIFNITTTLLLLPFGNLLATLAVRLLPDRKSAPPDEEKWFHDIVNSQHTLGVSTIALGALKADMKDMLRLAAENVSDSLDAILTGNISSFEKVENREEEIDLYNVRLSKRISKVLTVEQSYRDTNATNHIFKIIGNIERVGDHAMNLMEYAVHLDKKQLRLSDEAITEVKSMKHICMQALSELLQAEGINCMQVLGEAIVFEQQIDDTTALYRQNQIARIRTGECNIETSILYSEMLTDYERIGDHILNIAESFPEVEGI